MVVAALSILGIYAYLAPKLPNIETLKDIRLQVPLRVYSRGGELIAEFGEMKRSPLKYEEFPPLLIQAVLAAEDDRFFEHPGVDYQGILRAAYHLVRTGERAQGGSTITMQVARNFFLSREKTFLRKFNEIFLALKIEGELSKQEILELYLNKIYLGKRAYGFAAAAQVYYGKTPHELTLAEVAMTAGLPKAPSRYNPVVNMERAVIRRDYVLGRMRKLAYITEEQYTQGITEVDTASVHGQSIVVEAPYVAEMVRNEMLSRYGNEAYTAGYQVITTLDDRLQTAANSALREALLGYDRRHGYRGVVGHVDLFDNNEIVDMTDWQNLLADVPVTGDLLAGLVIQVEEQAAYVYTRNGNTAYLPWEKLQWARRYVDDNHMGPKLDNAGQILAEGDIILITPQRTGCTWLAQTPLVSGALVSLQPDTGVILALVGGFDFYQSKFNRVVQAKRQPGSSFKPFIYTAAIDKGFTAASIINDAPVVFDAPGLEDTWRPENYSGRFYGPTRLRQALVKSRNLVSIRLLRAIGIGYAVRYARRFGFERSSLPRDLSLALGSGVMTPLELSRGYAVFANGGYRITPYFIEQIIDPSGDVIFVANEPQVCATCPEETIEEFAIKPVAEQPSSEVAAAAATNAEIVPEVIKRELKDVQLTSGSERESDAIKPPPGGPQGATEENTAMDEAIADEVGIDEAVMDEEDADAETEQLIIALPPLIPAKRVLNRQTAFLMNTMMRDVIRHGTGRGALQLGRKDLAGKTGTTNEQRDAWFAGFNREIVAVAWVGFDNPRSLGNKETGARAALPMWKKYMEKALQGMPESVLEQPPGFVSVRIDPKTGRPASAHSPDAIFEYFLADQVPTAQPEIKDTRETSQEPSTITEQLF